MTNPQAIRDSIRTGTVPLSTYLALLDQYKVIEGELKRTKGLLEELTQVVKETVGEMEDLTYDLEKGEDHA